MQTVLINCNYSTINRIRKSIASPSTWTVSFPRTNPFQDTNYHTRVRLIFVKGMWMENKERKTLEGISRGERDLVPLTSKSRADISPNHARKSHVRSQASSLIKVTKPGVATSSCHRRLPIRETCVYTRVTSRSCKSALTFIIHDRHAGLGYRHVVRWRGNAFRHKRDVKVTLLTNRLSFVFLLDLNRFERHGLTDALGIWIYNSTAKKRVCSSKYFD